MILSRKQSHLYFRNKGLPVLIIIAKYVETSPMSINGWVEKQNVVHSYNDKWFSLKKKGKSDTCYTMGELWGHYAKWGKPVTKGRALPDPTYTYTRSPELSNSCQTSCWCLVAKSCLTFCDPMDCGPPGSSVHGIYQERILKWVAMPSSRGFSLPRDRTCVSCVSCVVGGFFTTEPPGKPRTQRERKIVGTRCWGRGWRVSVDGDRATGGQDESSGDGWCSQSHTCEHL